MIKKLIIVFSVFFTILFSLGITKAADDFTKTYNEAQKKYEEAVATYQEYLTKSKYIPKRIEFLKAKPTLSKDEEKELEELNKEVWMYTKEAVNTKLQELQQAQAAYIEARKNYDSSEAASKDFSSIWFKLDTNKLFPWNRYWKSDDYKQNIFDFLMDIIQKLMIWLGSIALLIIVIWSAFMILYHWEDSMLTKWKSIFSAWIISLIVALASYYMIEIVKYLINLN